MRYLALIALVFSLNTQAYVESRINGDAVIIDGELFYPLILWQCKDTACMDEVVQNGFNTALHSGISSTASDPTSTLDFLSMCEDAGIYCIPGIGRDAVRNLTNLESYLNAIKGSRALFAISLPDEGTTSYPNLGAGNTYEELVAAYDLIKRVTPGLIVIFDHYFEDNGVTWAETGDFTDFFGLDWYPFVVDPSWNSFKSWQDLTKTVHKEVLSGQVAEAIWQFNQTSAPTAGTHVAPTYADMALQFWSGVVYGLKGGAQFYGWAITNEGMQFNSDVKEAAYKLLADDVLPNTEWLMLSRETGPVFMDSDTCTIYQGDDPYVAFRMLELGSDYYFAIINGKYNSDCTGTLNFGLDDPEITMLYESTPSNLEMVDSKVDLTIERFGYKVWHMPRDGSLPPDPQEPEAECTKTTTVSVTCPATDADLPF